jgi:hypothetical protein
MCTNKLNIFGYIGENMIIYALIASGIKPEDIYCEYTFRDDLEFMQTGCKYDVYVKSLNAIIEHHGTQHIQKTNYFVHDNTTADESFNTRQEYDIWKKEYALKRNVRYIQFSIYDFPDTYMELPVLKDINSLLSVLGCRTLSDDELNKVIVDSRTNSPKGINNERTILLWNSMRFVFHTQNEASEILKIHKQTIQRWRETNESEFRFYNEYTTEDINIPSGETLKLIKQRLKERKSATGNRKRTGCNFVAIFRDENGSIRTEYFEGYESCAENDNLPIEFRASKNYLKRTIMRNSSEVAIKYNLMARYKNDCLFITTDVFQRMIHEMTIEELFILSGKNISKGKMPKVVCYEKENPLNYIVQDNATDMSKYLSSNKNIKISPTSIENACFYLDHKTCDTEQWRFCFLCEYIDRRESLKYIEEKNKTNSKKDIVLIWKGKAVAYGGMRLAERCLGVFRDAIKKQLNVNKKPIKGLCDFKLYNSKEYGKLPDFSEWNELDAFKQEYQSN